MHLQFCAPFRFLVVQESPLIEWKTLFAQVPHACSCCFAVEHSLTGCMHKRQFDQLND
jgi:hypothetical protein